VELRLFRIIGPLRQLAVEERIVARDRVVVADLPEAAQDVLEDQLAIDRVLHGEAQVRIVERCPVAGHHERVVLAARRTHDLAAGRAREPVHELPVDAVDQLHLARDQRVEPRRDVVDHDDLVTVEVAATGLPVVGIALGRDTHAGIERGDLERAGPDRPTPVREARRHDQKMEVGEEIRQIGVRLGERDPDLIRAHRLDRLDAGHDALGARGGVLAAMQVERVDDILGIERLAVGEGDALAQSDQPGLGVGLGLPAFGELRLDLALGIDLGEQVEGGEPGDRGHGVGIAARIERIDGAAAAEPDRERAAFLRLGGARPTKSRRDRRPRRS
jgi:hypothetical protein